MLQRRTYGPYGARGRSRWHPSVDYRVRFLLLVPLLLGGSLAGCGGGSNPSNSVTVESRSIPASSATSARVDIEMQPGNLQIRGGADRLMDARFTYRPSAWKPVVTYRVSGGRGALAIHQPQLHSAKDGKNSWEVSLSNHMPLDLAVASGPGNATLDLRALTLHTLTVAAAPGNLTIDAGSPSLRTIDVSAGPGNLDVNLIASWQHNITATVDGGIGNTTLRLPSGVGVRVALQHGEGLVTAHGFSERGGVYVNDAFGRSKVTVRIALTAGIGNVILTSEA